MSSPIPTRKLGGDASSTQVGAIGYGLMQLTWTPNPLPDEVNFPAMISAYEAGATTWNTGVFYNQPDQPEANLKMLQRFFAKYPEYIDKIVLCCKGGMDVESKSMKPNGSVDNLRADLARAQKALGDKKTIDIYEMARVDPTLTIEEAVKNLDTLRKEGLFKHIGLSEIAADAIRKANAVAPIASVEIEVSPWSMEDETYKVIKTCEELKIAIFAYSPLGRGFAGGTIRSQDDIPEGDFRKHSPKFSPENFPINLQLVDQLAELAKKRGVTTSQMTLAWILRLSPVIIPIPGSSKVDRTRDNISAAKIELSDDEYASIDKLLKSFKPAGERYPEHVNVMSWGTGKQ